MTVNDDNDNNNYEDDGNRDEHGTVDGALFTIDYTVSSVLRIVPFIVLQ